MFFLRSVLGSSLAAGGSPRLFENLGHGMEAGDDAPEVVSLGMLGSDVDVENANAGTYQSYSNSTCRLRGWVTAREAEATHAIDAIGHWDLWTLVLQFEA